MHPAWRLCCLLVAGMLAAAPASAQHDQASAGARQAAKALADKGLELYQAEQHEAALEAFRQAEATYHAPPFLVMLARLHAKLGHLLEARATYERVVNEALPKSAPRAFVQSQLEAKDELAALAPRIPTIEIAVTGAPVDEVQLTLDGAAVPLTTPVEQDPGSHLVVARAAGRGAVSKELTLREGGQERLVIVLPPAIAPATPLASGEQARPGGRNQAVVIGGLAGTAVGAVVGVSFAVVSFGKAADRDAIVPAGCDDRQLCAEQGRIDVVEYNRLERSRAHYSNLSFWSFMASGAVGMGTLAYVLLTPAREPGKAASGGVSLSVGPGTIAVTRRW